MLICMKATYLTRKLTNTKAHAELIGWLLINNPSCLQHQSTHHSEDPEFFPKTILFIAVALLST